MFSFSNFTLFFFFLFCTILYSMFSFSNFICFLYVFFFLFHTFLYTFFFQFHMHFHTSSFLISYAFYMFLLQLLIFSDIHILYSFKYNVYDMYHTYYYMWNGFFIHTAL